MNTCPSCAYIRKDLDIRCPQCGEFYPTLAQLLAEEVAYEELHSFKGRWQRIAKADDIKQAIRQEISQFKAELTTQGIFTLIVIVIFVFALVFSVL